MDLNNLISLPKTDIMLSSTDAISQICAPLRPFGICAFSHTRVYKDGTFIDMADRADVIDYFYYKTDIYKFYTPDVDPPSLGGGFALLNSLGENKCTQAMREDLHIDNVFILVEEKQNHYELWNFGGLKGNNDIVATYLNNIDVLRNFTFYFKEKTNSLIKKYEKDKIIRNLYTNKEQRSVTPTKKIEETRQKFYQSLEVKKFPLGDKYNNVHLTYKEASCVYWCAKGKTLAEIAIILGHTKRTIEYYILRAKIKLNIYKQTELVYKTAELGILDFLDKNFFYLNNNLEEADIFTIPSAEFL